MDNISGFGASLQIIPSLSYPYGFTVTEFADDTNPFELPSMQIQDKAMGVNGDLLLWSKANPIIFNLAVIPGTDADSDNNKLQTVFNNNRAARGKLPLKDVITIVAILPTGNVITMSQGGITDGKPGYTITSAGRLETMVYSFAFEQITGVN